MIDSIFTLVTMDAVDAVAVMDCYFTLVTIDAVDAVVAVDAKVNRGNCVAPGGTKFLPNKWKTTPTSPTLIQHCSLSRTE